ncbi:hypothetical protein [Pelotomaculum sp. FP]|uniref:hypothetical protein n=1 Tax=Pelotomaculum sp. FP TaxID=261474 RepID=UPI0012911625|nr:hypothetical protein [Pelotomaculum sp. FP]
MPKFGAGAPCAIKVAPTSLVFSLYVAPLAARATTLHRNPLTTENGHLTFERLIDRPDVAGANSLRLQHQVIFC